MSPETFNILGIWLAAFGTVAIYSFLYRENRLFRMVEHIFTGLAVGYTFYATWTQVLQPKWWNPLVGGPGGGHAALFLVALAATALGALWYFQFVPKYRWLSYIVIGVTIGATAGTTFKGEYNAQYPQVLALMKPVLMRDPPFVLWNNLIMLVMFSLVLSYFFFSFGEKSPAMEKTRLWGRYLMMLTFGVFFGNTVMTRFAVMIERVQFLLRDWLHLIH
ncbi:MAG: hypothetical protein ACREJQ_01920 [bacterium]